MSDTSSSRETAAPTAANMVAKALKENLLKEVSGGERLEAQNKEITKVTVVGVGNVGMACAQTMLTEGLCDELALVDVVADKLKGELLDLQHSGSFLPRTKLMASTDYSISKNSDLCVITAGARQRDGEARTSLVKRNADLLKSIVPPLVEHSPNTIILMVSNPVDILTHMAWKMSGLPSNRVIGSGTNLDSSRFRSLIADALDLNAQNVHGYIIGEHGDTSVPVWSGVSIAGVPLIPYLKTLGIDQNFGGEDTLRSIHKKVVDSAYEVIKLKGYTNWAIGYSVTSLARSILRDQRRIHPVSVLVKGMYGMSQEIHLSLPCILGRSGILSVVQPPLQEEEVAQLKSSAQILEDIANSVHI